ncbi:unnamed protein product [Mesocestoides corti]|uniref:FCP1 homology domain-containing protein n=1 Tax=Mesocestoides corti TaxID=53468 RepID=A0A0R3UMP4_MESCO|nr:unnamed protein product [Mesocestoides corti]
MDDELIGPLKVKFNGKLLELDGFSKGSRVIDLKDGLYQRTNVLPKNQKLLGLVAEKGYILSDELPLKHLVLKPTTKLMLMGCTEEEIKKVIELSNAEPPDVIDDYDFTEEDVEVLRRPENLEKLERRCKTYKFIKIAEFRPGKRLLVLDIDFTIFDHQTPAESARHLMRPYLFEFLTRAYDHYDIAIWSATSMTWILAKISQMNLISQTVVNRVRNRQVEIASSKDDEDNDSVPNLCADLEIPDQPFRLCLLIDSGAIISVNLPDHGVKGVKPLAIIWRKFTQFGPHNTIMFDDVRRNFAMNPDSGLRIHSYRDANVNYATDKELYYLADYLELIAQRETDFQRLNHDKWASYVEKHRRLLSANYQKRPSDEANDAQNDHKRSSPST